MADKQAMRRVLFFAAAAVLFGFPVCETYAQVAPTVTASTASLTFNWTQGATLPVVQTLSVHVSAGTPAYTVATPAPNAWLLATP